MQLGIVRGIHHCTAPGRGDLRVRPAQLCDLSPLFGLLGLSTRTAIATRAATNADRAHLRADSWLWPLRLRLGSEGLGDRAQPQFAQRSLAARRRGQQGCECGVHGQHNTHLGHKPPRPRQVAIVHTPEHLQPRVRQGEKITLTSFSVVV